MKRIINEIQRSDAGYFEGCGKSSNNKTSGRSHITPTIAVSSAPGIDGLNTKKQELNRLTSPDGSGKPGAAFLFGGEA